MQTVASLYNPDQLTETELIDRFVVRLKTFQRLFKDIKESKMENAEQHILIEAQRGMGKTTMLLRLSYEVEKTPELNNWLIPIMFNEEQYGVSRLFKLWESIAKHLEDKNANFIGLFDEMDALYEQFSDTKNYEKAAFDLLIQRLEEKGKKLILFIDNFGDMFKKFDKTETQRFRSILMTCPDIRIIAASSKVTETFFEYKEPLYEFFKMVRLKGLNKQEAEELLLKLGESLPENPVAEIIETQPQRIETLRRLTGGIIRTMILLFEVFLDNKNGDAFNDLEKILDRVTPLYKHRMDDLSKQQQEIVNIIALEWDAISTKDIATKTRLESKKVSAQLKQLIDNDIIEKIPTNNKNHLYAIKERFFNIWYLMRNGRKNDKQRVKWLVRFFESWCDGKTLQERVQKHIDYLKSGNYNIKGAYFLSEALADVEGIDLDLQHELLEVTRGFLNSKDEKLAKSLSISNLSTLNKLASEKKFKEIVKLYKNTKNKSSFLCTALGSSYVILNEHDKALKHLYFSLEEIDKKGDLWDLKITTYKLIITCLLVKGNFDLALATFDKSEIDIDKLDYYGEILMFSLLLLFGVFMSNNTDEDEKFKSFLSLLTKKELKHVFLSNIWIKILLDNTTQTENYFKLVLATKNYELLRETFNSNFNEEHNLINKYKPYYYALMYFQQDKYPNEYLKMGSELKETVEEIIEEVKAVQQEFAKQGIIENPE